MPDLEPILRSEPIIATFPVQYLKSNPDQVELSYRTYARMHMSLGDTSRYVDTILRWVSGTNQGAFVGAVVGDYGHGKTSFQVHIWEQSTQRQVLAVPPFSWNRVADMVDGTAAWVQHRLNQGYAELARRVERVHEQYKERLLRQIAEDTARRTGRNVDEVLATLEATVAAGATIDNPADDPNRFLDFCEKITEIVREAGYTGLLVLMDEPEVAAQRLGSQRVAGILFDLANGLLQRQGNYGVFFSIPENFLATAQTMFASLPARLQGRNCFPRLRDIYGPDFPRALWARYVEEFDIGEEERRIVTPEALQALGQIASSDRSDLSYGPRTVVSAFRRMVYRYKEGEGPYSPLELVSDCLSQEVLVKPDYRTRVREVLDAPEAGGFSRELLQTLAAFPNGLPRETADALGIGQEIQDLARRGGPNLVFRMGNLVGLTRLRRPEIQVDELREAVQDVFGQFAPSRSAFETARDAFIQHLVPRLLMRRQGQQLTGWDGPDGVQEWSRRPDGTKLSEWTGAFPQTARDYPRRNLVVAVGPLGVSTRDIASSISQNGANGIVDLVLHFQVRWAPDTALPAQWVALSCGDPSRKEPGVIGMVLDFAGDPLPTETLGHLEELVDGRMLTPLGVLYLIGEMDHRTLANDFQAQWTAIRDQLIRKLLERFLADRHVLDQAQAQVNEALTDNAFELLGGLARYILRKRYPNYSTLIRQPHWEAKLDDYIRALRNTDIPLACRRGREVWSAPGEQVARALDANVMNLTGGAFTGFESLITIQTRGNQGVQVQFKMHPFEQEIMELIQTTGERRQIEGKECWWLPFSSLSAQLLTSGYQHVELRKIVEIGVSRGTFKDATIDGTPGFYVLPLDVDQMKQQLREKLEDLQKQVDALNKLPNYHSTFDIAEASREIESLADEAHYEALNHRITQEMHHNRARIPGHFDLLSEEFARVRRDVQQIKELLDTSRELSGLDKPVSGQSRWCADLNRCIRRNLLSTCSEAKRTCQELLQKIDQCSGRYVDAPASELLARVNLVIEGQNAAKELDEKAKSLRREAEDLQRYGREYEQWRALLKQSDEVSNSLDDMRQDPAHEAKVRELVEELDKVWRDISDHLQTRNLQGLASHAQFQKQIEQIDGSRKTYIRGLQTEFNKRKEAVNRLLEELALPSDSRCRETFNPAEVEGCHKRLIDEAVGHLQKALDLELGEIETQKREVLYARDILARLKPEEAQPVLERLESAEGTLADLKKSVGADWILQASLAPDAEIRKQAKDVLQEAREAIRVAKNTIRQSDGSRSPELSEGAKRMLGLVPDTQSVDLKELILKRMDGQADSATILSTSLEYLAELFRKGRIGVRVERTRR